MFLKVEEIPRIIDISAVKAAARTGDVLEVAEMAKKYNFVCAFAMPCFTPLLIRSLKGYPSINIGGAVGFPSGADTTDIKTRAAIQLIEMGCNEIDMVINVGALKSGELKMVADDIAAVVDACGNIPVKSILEIAYLTDEEIITGSRIAIESGVAFVKTGTGWAEKATTLDTIRIIKSEIGDRARVKAAGGVRTLEDLEDMYKAGCDRFGIGTASALQILKTACEREGIDLKSMQ